MQPHCQANHCNLPRQMCPHPVYQACLNRSRQEEGKDAGRQGGKEHWREEWIEKYRQIGREVNKAPNATSKASSWELPGSVNPLQQFIEGSLPRNKGFLLQDLLTHPTINTLLLSPSHFTPSGSLTLLLSPSSRAICSLAGEVGPNQGKIL